VKVQLISDGKITGGFSRVNILRVDRVSAEVVTPSDAFMLPVEAGRWSAVVEAPEGLVIRTADGNVALTGHFSVKVTGMGRVQVDMPTDKWFCINAPLVTFNGVEEEAAKEDA
jgi:hypothetical protein